MEKATLRHAPLVSVVTSMGHRWVSAKRIAEVIGCTQNAIRCAEKAKVIPEEAVKRTGKRSVKFNLDHLLMLHQNGDLTFRATS